MKLKKVIVGLMFCTVIVQTGAVSAASHHQNSHRETISSRSMGGYTTNGSLWSSIKHKFGW